MDENETVIVRTQNTIKRKRIRGGVSIISQPEEKTYRVCFLKRRRLNDNIYIRSECGQRTYMASLNIRLPVL